MMNKNIIDIEDPGALRGYLEGAGHVLAGAVVEMRRLAGGVSNRTVLVRFADGRAWVLKQALEKLRVAVEWHCSPERIHSEAEGLRWFGAAAPAGAVPELIFEDRVQHILCMQAVAEPHANWKTQLMEAGPDEGVVRKFGELLAHLHREGERRRDEAAQRFDDLRFFRALRLEPYYAYTGQQVPALAAFMERLMVECLANRHTVVHGDYSPKNVLVQAGRIVLIDHEVAHFGDGAFDVGFALAHLLSKAHHFPARRAAFRQAALTFWERYAAVRRVDAAFARRCVMHGLGCLAARGVGRSPLEYLDDAARRRQVAVVTAMVLRAPGGVAEMVEGFCGRVG